MKTPLVRLMEKVRYTAYGCWEWTASLYSFGYGQFSYQGKPQPAHRVAYWLLAGQIPEGLELDHLCRNRACINPSHLEPVTRKENLRRGIGSPWKQSAYCKRGHLFEDRNTYSGQRRCRECLRIRGRLSRLNGPGIGFRRNWTHCIRGHEFTSETTYIQNGYRSCRVCRKANKSRWEKERKLASNATPLTLQSV